MLKLLSFLIIFSITLNNNYGANLFPDAIDYVIAESLKNANPRTINTQSNNLMCNVNVTTANGGVTVTGLTSDANAKLFDSSININTVTLSCNIWEGRCNGTESVSGLVVGATYYLSVESSTCSEWIPIVIAGGGGGNGGSFAITSCPDDIAITTPHGGDYSAVVNWNPPTATTDCPGGVTIEQVLNSGLGGAPGTRFETFISAGQQIVYRISDACGNSEICSFRVRLRPEPPVLTCPQDMTVTATSAAGAVVNYPTLSIITFCDPLPVELGEGLPSGSVFPIGTTSININTFLSGPAGFCQTRSNCNFDITVLPPDAGDCNINVSSANGNVVVTGLTSNNNTKLFNSSVSSVWSCNPWQNNPCSNRETITGLPAGNYFLSVQQGGCDEWIPVTVQGGGGCSDADNDGTCDADDCQPNNPSRPATPGASCNDGNSNTTNDVIQPDGCGCAGIPVGGGCNVNITSSNGGVTITGLSSNANTKLFNSNTVAVFSCNPWQGNTCSGTETVSGLSVGATYFLSVQSSVCDEWIPITIQGGGGGNGGGGNGPDLLPNSLSIGAGAAGSILGFTFNLVNQGNRTASGSYSIKSYISTNNTLSNDDIQEGTIGTGNTAVGSTSVNGAITVPNLSPGTYFLVLVVDDGNNIAETNERNNVVASRFEITAGSGGSSGGGCNPTNVARGKSATQSSTITAGGVTGSASKAVDGNTNGNFFAGSVSATNNEFQGYWQVDLGANYELSTIEIFNRTEGSARLDDFYVFASDRPFTSSNLGTAQSQSFGAYISLSAGTPTTLDFTDSQPARYIRIQRDGNGHVTLAEVRVNGCLSNLPDGNVQSFAAQEEESQSKFSVQNLFPNPTNGEVIAKIDSNFEGAITMQVTNMMGQLIKEEKITVADGSNNFLLNMDSYKAGIYQVNFSDGNKVVSQRIVKM